MRRILITFTAFFMSLASAIDLCFLFNSCNKNNNRRPNYSGPKARQVDQEWIEAEGSDNGLIYHFANSVNAMDWFEADRYCENKGGYLAEPTTSEEQEFLRNEAFKFGAVNWWMGLRETESCRCTRRGSSIDASLDPDSLFQASGGPVQTYCPSGFRKQCSGRGWRWSFLDEPLTSSIWHGRTREPNGPQEHCALMWNKVNFDWADWRCTTKMNTGHPFKPLCQKEKFPDYDQETPRQPKMKEKKDDDVDLVELEQVTKCIDSDVFYRSRGRDRIGDFKGISSFSECQQKCRENTQCAYWIWRGDNQAQRCILTSAIRRNNFRISRPGVYSGAMDADCPSSSTSSETTQNHCVDYGSFYDGLPEKEVLEQVGDAETCRKKCAGSQGCLFWSWQSGSQTCFMYGSGSYSIKRRPGFVSGSSLGQCAIKTLKDMQDCQCLGEDFPVFEEDYDEYVDLVGSGLIDLRTLQTCGQNQIKRCSIGQSSSGSTPKPDRQQPPKLQKKDVCGDFNVYYNGAELMSLNNIPFAGACRAVCLQHPECQEWTWTGPDQGRRCILLKSADYTPEHHEGYVSGTLHGECATVAIDRLRSCECYSFDGDYDYEEDGPDLVDLIDLRSGAPPSTRLASSTCQKEEGFRCYAESPANQGFISSRINFG